MQIKGAGIKPLKDIIKENFQEEGYKQWLDLLSPDVKKIYSGGIISSAWYPLLQFGNDPLEKAISHFYQGDRTKAWMIGRTVAQMSLSGVHKVLVQVGKPNWLISRAKNAMSTYFKPCEIELEKIDKNNYKLKILKFSEMTDLLEYHMGGWIEKALEISGGKNVKVEIAKKMTAGDGMVAYDISWS